MLSLVDGTRLVRLARETIKKYFRKKKLSLEKIESKTLNEKRGIFVTILKFPGKGLRGCIGFPTTDLPMWEAVQRSAYSSAFDDPRFPPMKEEELDMTIFEVSVMTKPKLITVKDPKEYFERIEIGKDGLILANGPFGGLLLPHVAVEFNWSVEEFLENLCYKSNLTPDWIYNKNTRIWKFQTQLFVEKEPVSEVVEVKSSEHA